MNPLIRKEFWNINESLSYLEDSRKILKISYILVGKGFLPNRKSTSQKEVNNKIRTACSDLYRKSFSNSDSPETLLQHRTIPLESYGKVSIIFGFF
jgi:hypothetical protein